MKKLIIVCSLFLLTNCYNQETIVDKNTLLGYDYRLFQSTPAWTLAKAVQEQDIVKIKEEVLKNKVPVNYKETRFGSTLLFLAIFNGQYESAQTLLELGANPNLADTYQGTTPIIQAASNEDPKYLALLLKYKGNPNSSENAPEMEGNTTRNTALIKAISFEEESSLKKVRMLIDAGANVNSDNQGRTNLPLSLAIMLGKMQIVLCLLENNADYSRAMFSIDDEHKVYILEALRKCQFDLGSEKHKQKLQVIAFLKSKGLDYNKEPIPDDVLENIKKNHPNDWEKYAREY